eukprot:365195-Chlamydomonas_euryale.AAC.8
MLLPEYGHIRRVGRERGAPAHVSLHRSSLWASSLWASSLWASSLWASSLCACVRAPALALPQVFPSRHARVSALALGEAE